MTDLNQVFEGHWLGRVADFSLIPRICFGVGAANKVGGIGKGIAKNTNAIIVTDNVLVKLGIIDGPKKSLEEAGFKVDVCGSESAEPVIEEVRRVINVVRGKDYGLVVGIGGGSAMDRAKSAAVMAKTAGDLEEYLLPSKKPLEGSLPKIMIDTTAGTGSEVSAGLVVIVHGEKQKAVKTFVVGDLCLADVAVVDPALMIECPPRVTAGSGMDALAHNAEGVLCLGANPWSDALALKAVELVSQNLRTAVHQGENIEARWNMAWAASLGGIVCGLPWVNGPATPCHITSEAISAKYGFPHGESCGVLLPFTYWFNLRDAYGRKKIAKVAEAMGEDVAYLETKAAAQQAITATFDLLEDIGLPTSLKEYNVPKNDIPSLTAFVLDRAVSIYGMNDINPVKGNSQNMREFLEISWEGRGAVGL